MSTRAVVAIVGAGASGTLVAAHLAAAAGAAQRPVELLLIDPDPPGRGLAYRTTDPRHRLNVPAKGMSAWPADPGHFVRWLRRHVAVDAAEGMFAPRLHYAQYLADVLDRAVQDNPGVHLTHLPHRVTDLRSHGNRLRLSLSDGTSRPADTVVLALGHGSPSATWAPPELLASGRFVADPWQPASRPQLRRGDEVVLVGAGLTAADMAQSWARDGIRVHVVSRHGMLPLPHASSPQAARDPGITELPTSATRARQLVFDAIRAADGDWRRAVDGFRPLTQRLWAGLAEPERQQFLAGAVRRWDRVRHRIDPALHSWLEQRSNEGSLVVHTASVTAAEAGPHQVTVTLSDGSTIGAAAVVNCTGTCTAVGASHDPLVLNVLSSGLAQSGPLGLGFGTDPSGRLQPRSGQPRSVWTIGPLRRGELWESTAIPEIRTQAAALAPEILAALPAPRVRRRPRDPYGLPISANGAAAAGYVEALHRILRVQSGAEPLLEQAVAADPSFALGHAVRALLGVEWGADVDVEASLQAAQSAGAQADERERHFIEVAEARVREPGAGSAAALLAYLQAYPEDALAVSLAVPTIAFGGATEIPAEAWALIEGLAPAYGADWWYLGMLAFIRQEQDRFGEAAELSARALLLEPAAGHAVHAKSHVHYETGDHLAGLRWLDSWIDSCGARAAHRAHFSWHAALHELALGDTDAVLARYHAQLAPPGVTGVRGLVDSASLLWRLKLTGAPVDELVRTVLAGVPASLLTEPATPFIGMHAAVALAAADDCHGLARLRRYAAGRPGAPFAETVAGLADALTELVLGDADRASISLQKLGNVDSLGGSAAQREVVSDTLLHCARQAGHTEVETSILAGRLARRRSPQAMQRLHG